MVEAAAIFAAVTLGFLAEDYRDSRGDRAQARELLVQLVSDLQVDAGELEETIQSGAPRAEALTWLHNNVARVGVPADSVVLALNGVLVGYSYEAHLFAYSGLRNSGRLDLIEDQGLRDRIVFYFEDRVPYLLRLTDGVIREEDEWRNLLAPHITLAPCAVLDDWPEVESVDLSTLSQDRLLRWAIADFGNWSWVEANWSRRTIELNAALVGAIEDYLERF